MVDIKKIYNSSVYFPLVVLFIIIIALVLSKLFDNSMSYKTILKTSLGLSFTFGVLKYTTKQQQQQSSPIIGGNFGTDFNVSNYTQRNDLYNKNQYSPPKNRRKKKLEREIRKKQKIQRSKIKKPSKPNIIKSTNIDKLMKIMKED